MQTIVIKELLKNEDVEVIIDSVSIRDILSDFPSDQFYNVLFVIWDDNGYTEEIWGMDTPWRDDIGQPDYDIHELAWRIK